MKFKKIEASEITKRIDPIKGMEADWALLTAEYGEQANTMTVAWGAFGNVWWKPTVIMYVRPQRYTKEFMDQSGKFTLTFFEDRKREMTYLGSTSGRDEADKIEKSGLHLTHVDAQPTFEEGKLVLLCKTMYHQPMKPEHFIDAALAEQNYPDKDYSEIYIAEIEAAYEFQK